MQTIEWNFITSIPWVGVKVKANFNYEIIQQILFTVMLFAENCGKNGQTFTIESKFA